MLSISSHREHENFLQTHSLEMLENMKRFIEDGKIPLNQSRGLVDILEEWNKLTCQLKSHTKQPNYTGVEHK